MMDLQVESTSGYTFNTENHHEKRLRTELAGSGGFGLLSITEKNCSEECHEIRGLTYSLIDWRCVPEIVLSSYTGNTARTAVRASPSYWLGICLLL